jgi:type II secretory pathway component GspD/PulD (secretin)
MFKYTVLFAMVLSLAAPVYAQPPQPAPAQAPAQQPAPSMGTLNLQNASLTEVVDSLAKQLRMNVIYDVPLTSLKGGVTLNTYGDPRNLDPRNLLDQILQINGFGITQAGDLYHIFALKQVSHQPIHIQKADAKDIPDDDQLMLNLVFLKYITVDGLLAILSEFAGDNAQIKAYRPPIFCSSKTAAAICAA